MEVKRILAVIVCLFPLTTTIGVWSADFGLQSDAAEKPLIIKGLRIDMGLDEAKEQLKKILNKGWTVSGVGYSYRLLLDYQPGRNGDEDVFGSGMKIPDVGEMGMLIKDDSGYHGGYISIDKISNNVSRITFGGKLTNDLFSVSSLSAEDFVYAFKKHFNMPEFNWVPYGWRYVSPNGYVIHIKTNKYLDIKKEILPKRPIVNFD